MFKPERNGIMLDLAERMEEEVLDKYNVEESKKRLSEELVPPWNGGGYAKRRDTEQGNWEKLLGKNFLPVQRMQLAAAAKQAGGVGERRRRERMKTVKNLTKKIRSKGRMEAESRWWVCELLAADCEKACKHPGWEETMQNWYEWLEKMKKKRMRRERWRRVINKKWRK